MHSFRYMTGPDTLASFMEKKLDIVVLICLHILKSWI